MRIFIAGGILAATTIFAIAAPPDGTKLSAIIARIEAQADVAHVDEVDWHNRGYYENEYVLKNGAKVDIRIDPKTGETVR